MTSPVCSEELEVSLRGKHHQLLRGRPDGTAATSQLKVHFHAKYCRLPAASLMLWPMACRARQDAPILNTHRANHCLTNIIKKDGFPLFLVIRDESWLLILHRPDLGGEDGLPEGRGRQARVPCNTQFNILCRNKALESLSI